MTRAVDALRAELASAGTPVTVDTSELEGTIAVALGAPRRTGGEHRDGRRGLGGPAAEELQRLVDERVEARVAEQVAERVAELTRASRSASLPPSRSREPPDRSRATRRASRTCSSATG